VKQERIKEILGKISIKKVAVYGDFCLDVYWHMDPDGSEVSVETGLKAEAVARHHCSPGGAGNIVANLAALSPAAIHVIGVIGNDIHGRELLSQLQALGVNTDSLIIQEDKFNTYTYTKKYHGDQEDPRIDFGVKNIRSPETDHELLRKIEWALGNCDVLIFNQQVSGSISDPEFISGCNRLFERFSEKIVVLDSRHHNTSFKYVYRKVNEIEIPVLNGVEVDPRDYIPVKEIRKHGLAVYRQHEKPVFVTCGARGIVCIDSSGINEIPGVWLHRKLDTVGAGDTVISALALCLASGISSVESARFSNLAAAVTVQKMFTTGTATGMEILDLNADVVYNHRTELAENINWAQYIPGSRIEICDHQVISRMGMIRHALFDHDGTISILRQGWEVYMESMMIRAILGDQYQDADGALLKEVRQRVLGYIDMSTGIQTILQMEALVEMVKEFKLVPQDRILDRFGYKEIYNRALLEEVSRRLEKLEKKQLESGDYTVNEAVDFLKVLRAKGVKLYLASGTDREDVIHEAGILGYADLFDGGIFGSEDDIKKYSKKIIINRIIRENNLNGKELVVFGDGPVEIREGIRVNGIAVGVASDESSGNGLNMEKRSRLIRSGAQIIIPDFSESTKLIDLLFNR